MINTRLVNRMMVTNVLVKYYQGLRLPCEMRPGYMMNL